MKEALSSLIKPLLSGLQSNMCMAITLVAVLPKSIVTSLMRKHPFLGNGRSTMQTLI